MAVRSSEWQSRSEHDRSHTSRYRPREIGPGRESGGTGHASGGIGRGSRSPRSRTGGGGRRIVAAQSRQRSPPRRYDRRRSRSPRWQRSPRRQGSPPQRRRRSPPRRRQRSPPPEPRRRKPPSRSVSPVVTAESTATAVPSGGPTLDSVMRAHPRLSVTDAGNLARKTGSAADKAVGAPRTRGQAHLHGGAHR